MQNYLGAIYQRLQFAGGLIGCTCKQTHSFAPTLDIGNLYVRSDQNQMIPLSNLVKITPITGAQAITHFNLFRQLNSTVQAEGSSSGEAIKQWSG